MFPSYLKFFFFFNDTATTEIYTLSHTTLFRSYPPSTMRPGDVFFHNDVYRSEGGVGHLPNRSEEHTSELQSRPHLVCRLLLEKKKTQLKNIRQKKTIKKRKQTK